MVTSHLQASTFLMRDFAGSTLDSTYFLNLSPGPRRRLRMSNRTPILKPRISLWDPKADNDSLCHNLEAKIRGSRYRYGQHLIKTPIVPSNNKCRAGDGQQLQFFRRGVRACACVRAWAHEAACVRACVRERVCAYVYVCAFVSGCACAPLCATWCQSTALARAL